MLTEFEPECMPQGTVKNVEDMRKRDVSLCFHNLHVYRIEYGTLDGFESLHNPLTVGRAKEMLKIADRITLELFAKHVRLPSAGRVIVTGKIT